ncbi:MAG TPA: response regulator transcription factor [Nocardioidaceae bacterium]|jgi:DNA-binding NarL/FixJ family response regulator|nr:response regulator transcription factor [Nocardioidaceae bacterium]
MKTVLLADDHALVRAGLASLIDTTEDLLIIGEAANGEDAVRLAVDLLPDVVVMDLSMPVMDGGTAIRLLLHTRPWMRVVVLTSNYDEERISEALAAGAVGFVLKDADPDRVLDAIRAACS